MAKYTNKPVGNGGTSGVQSDASTSEADRLLSYNQNSERDGLNICSGWSKSTRYTGDYNKA